MNLLVWIDAIPWYLDTLVALVLYSFAVEPKYSNGRALNPCFGYGKMDKYGFFDYPIPYECLVKRHKKLIDKFIQNNPMFMRPL